MPPRDRTTAYLLVGGASRRMGRCKARLEVDGTPLVLHLARALEASVHQVVIVAKAFQSFEDLGLPVLVDTEEERALVHGLATALRAAGPEWRFICSADMPEVGPRLLQRLYETSRQSESPGSYPLRSGADVPEPLPSLWRLPLRGAMETWGMSARNWTVAAGLAPCRLSPEEDFMLAHVNEPNQWLTYLEERSRRLVP